MSSRDVGIVCPRLNAILPVFDGAVRQSRSTELFDRAVRQSCSTELFRSFGLPATFFFLAASWCRIELVGVLHFVTARFDAVVPIPWSSRSPNVTTTFSFGYA